MNTVTVSNNQFYSHYPKRIPKGTVEAERVLVRLDPEWDGLTVRIHWANQASGKEVVSLLERDKPNSIPWEVLSDLGELRMGLLGLDGETTVKPTIWLSYGYVVEGVDPESGDDPQPPTPSWEQQMVEQATAAAEAAKAAQEAAELAGPYAQAAQASAEAAKASEVSAAASAQEAGQSQAAAAQAQASAQGHATTAQQAAQEAQAAQESAAQSAQAAATDAQRAETASQEAQDAAARAEAVDAYPRQDANNTFALALKTDTGKGTSHEIYPDPGSNIVVTAYGFTEQEGGGDPSPENKRAIKVGGLKLVEKKITADDPWYKYSSTAGAFYTTLPVKAFKNFDTVYTDSNVLRFTTSAGATENGMYISGGQNWLFIFLNEFGITELEDAKNWVKNNPFTVWYAPEDVSSSTGLYTNSKIVDREKRAFNTCLPITEPLCDGDYVVSNQDGQCVEVHTAQYVRLLPEEWRIFSQDETGVRFANSTLAKSNWSGVNTICSHLKAGSVVGAVTVPTFSVSTGSTNINIKFPIGAGVDTVEQLNRFLTDNQVYLTGKIKAPVTYTHTPVPLIARPDSTGKVTVSGEKEVSAVYNKSIQRAIDEINAAILQLGGAQNV